MRYSPPFFGWAAAALVPRARRKVAANLVRLRGQVGPAREAREVLALFSNYASCLSEVLSNGSKNGADPTAEVRGRDHVAAVMGRWNPPGSTAPPSRLEHGVIFATAHTAGWELVGPLLGRDYGTDLLMVMAGERDPRARDLHDRARRPVEQVKIVHVGDDPLASLPLLQHLRRGGIVALQIDRVPPQMRTRQVSLFDAPGAIPEGPLRLAQVSGAPILPIFTARQGFRRYLIEAFPPVRVARKASDRELDLAAQSIGDSMTTFLREHPDQWFDFG
jgi:KDO2-lipid IV(A) lauroyltransferase